MAQPPVIPAGSRPAPVNPFYNQGMSQPASGTSNAITSSNPFDSEPPPYNPPASSSNPRPDAFTEGSSTQASYRAPPPPLPSRNRLSPHTTGNEMDRAPSPRRNVPPLPTGGMMHAAPAMPPSRTSARPQGMQQTIRAQLTLKHPRHPNGEAKPRLSYQPASTPWCLQSPLPNAKLKLRRHTIECKKVMVGLSRGKDRRWLGVECRKSAKE